MFEANKMSVEVFVNVTLFFENVGTVKYGSRPLAILKPGMLKVYDLKFVEPSSAPFKILSVIITSLSEESLNTISEIPEPLLSP